MNRILPLIFLFACFLTSCQKQAPKETQILNIDFQEGDLPSLHPHDLVIYLRGLSLTKNLYESLTRINNEGKPVLAGAESVQISSDQLCYLFKIRDHRWSDGTKVTAHHYEQAWKAALSPRSTCSRADLLYCIKNAEKAKKGEVPLDAVGVRATDEKTLVVELAYPSPFFLELMSQSIAVPLKDPETKEQTVFNGPFIVSEWKKGNFLRLKRNPHYWDKNNVHLQEVNISFIEDMHTVFSLFEKQEIDWIGVPLCPLSVEMIYSLQQSNSLNAFPIGRSFWVFLNTQHPALSSPSIRKALSLAIDRSAISEHILVGSTASEKPLSYRLLPLATPSTFKEDIQEANRLFEIGLAELALTREDFPPLEVTYSQQANRKQVAEYLQERWHNALGIDVRLKSEEWNVLRSNLEKGLFTISMAYEGAFYKDPLELLERYASLNPSNFSKWLNPVFEDKIADARFETDSFQRMKKLGEAEMILMEQMPFIPICSDCILFSHAPTLKGYVIDSIGAIDFSRADKR